MVTNSDEKRESYRVTFDSAADRYHRARPRYPQALVNRLVDLTGLQQPHSDAHALEIGPATGVATEQLATFGFAITALELGPQLAAAARANLAIHPNVFVQEGSFDTWDPPNGQQFDLVFAATAWHWMDPATKYTRAHQHLKPGGHLAFWSANHVMPDGGDPFFAQIQPVYQGIGEALPDAWRFAKPGEQPTEQGEIEASGWFDVVAVEHFDWEISYTVEQYLDLLSTFSGHIAMAQSQKDRLSAEIEKLLAKRPSRSLRRHWGAVLHVAQARGSVA